MISFAIFKIGQQNLLNGKCSEARKQKELIAQLMAVPLVQGTLRYAYLTDQRQSNVGEKAKAEGATFAASVLPIVHACNEGDAETIYENLSVGGPGADFEAVKEAFENNYKCMGITCSDVGGLYDDATFSYFQDASPCSDSSTSNSRAIAIGVSCGVIGAALLVGVLCLCKSRRKAGIDNKFTAGSSTATSPVA